MTKVEYELMYGDLVDDSCWDETSYIRSELMSRQRCMTDDQAIERFHKLYDAEFHIYDYIDLIKETTTWDSIVSQEIIATRKKDIMTYELDIDTMPKTELYKYFANIYYKMGLYPNTPYVHKVTTNVDWLEFIDRMKTMTNSGVKINQQVAQSTIGEIPWHSLNHNIMPKLI